MSQPRFPDPASSRAVLIGASHFTAAGPELPDIPAVQANLIALRQALSSSDTGVLRPERCRVLADPTSPDEVGTALSEAAATATDLLLVYYAGHGLVDDRSGRLHLALAHTRTAPAGPRSRSTCSVRRSRTAPPLPGCSCSTAASPAGRSKR